MDQDSAFMSSLMNYLFKKFDIKIKTVAPLMWLNACNLTPLCKQCSVKEKCHLRHAHNGTSTSRNV